MQHPYDMSHANIAPNYNNMIFQNEINDEDNKENIDTFKSLNSIWRGSYGG